MTAVLHHARVVHTRVVRAVYSTAASGFFNSMSLINAATIAVEVYAQRVTALMQSLSFAQRGLALQGPYQ